MEGNEYFEEENDEDCMGCGMKACDMSKEERQNGMCEECEEGERTFTLQIKHL